MSQAETSTSRDEEDADNEMEDDGKVSLREDDKKDFIF